MSDLHKHHEDHPEMVSRSARRGLALFCIYFAFFLTFLFLNVRHPEWMAATSIGDRSLGGVNVAVIFGVGLILLAFVLALVYMRLTRNPRT